MKQNQLDTLTHEIVVNVISINHGEDKIKTDKIKTREKADKLVNWFLDNSSWEDMKLHLTESFESMDRQLVFGVRGTKTKSGTDLVTMKKNSSARFIQRSFNSLKKEDRDGLILSGYAPFKLEEEEDEVEQTNEEKMVEALESIGADITCINECKTSLSFSEERKEARLVERDKAIAAAAAAAEKDEKLAVRNAITDRLLSVMDKGTKKEEITGLLEALSSGTLTIADVTAAIAAKTA